MTTLRVIVNALQFNQLWAQSPCGTAPAVGEHHAFTLQHTRMHAETSSAFTGWTPAGSALFCHRNIGHPKKHHRTKNRRELASSPRDACQLWVASLRRWSVNTLSDTSSVMMTSADVSDCDVYVLDGFSRASRKRACVGETRAFL